MVPVALVDGDHLHAGVGLDQAGDVGERPAEVGVGVAGAGGDPAADAVDLAEGALEGGEGAAAVRPAGGGQTAGAEPGVAEQPEVLERADARPRGQGPRRAGRACPTATACSGRPRPFAPTTRSSQPVRTLVPGAARSSSSIAEKWLRVPVGCPTATTAPSRPASQSGLSGARVGCRPKPRSAGSATDAGTAIDGRAAA